MYVMITSRCNMTCKHCSQACTAEGDDMSLRTFRRALRCTVRRGDPLAIGGGEPTIHPKFWLFLQLALAESRLETIWLATNGSMTTIALALARLAAAGAIEVVLSQDAWHDPIDPRVVAAFEHPVSLRRREYDFRGIRRVQPDRVLAGGRCDWGVTGCGCPGPYVRPDGSVHQCGCLVAPKVGDVFNGFHSLGGKEEDDGEDWTCFQKLPKKELCHSS